MKKLIVIEGRDGSGKSTQIELLKKKLDNARFITFPYYESDSGRIISEYLRGTYAETDPRKSAYSASIMYAVDRYTSFKTHWEALYSSGSPVISARYVSSNAIYQMTKLPKSEWDSYLEWLTDLEYVKLGLPRPDLTIYLDMPTDISQKLLSKRYGGDETKKDIHERDITFLEKCRETAMYSADKFGWKIINCAENGDTRSMETINDDILKLINK